MVPAKQWNFFIKYRKNSNNYYVGKFSIEKQTELANISLIFKGFTQKYSTFLITARAKSQADDSRKERPTVKSPIVKKYMCQFRWRWLWQTNSTNSKNKKFNVSSNINR